MSSPVGTALNNLGNTGITTLPITFTTGANNTLVVLHIGTDNTSAFSAVQAVVVPGLLFSLMQPNGIPAAIQQANCISGVSPTTNVRTELWAAWVPTAGAYSGTIAVTNGPAGGIACLITGFTGTNGTAAFDSGALPVTASNAGGASTYTTTVTFSTLQADDLLVIHSCYNIAIVGLLTPSGWTINNGIWGTGGLDNVTFTKSVSAPQVAATAALTFTTDLGDASGHASLMYALTADKGGNSITGCGPAIPRPS